MGKKIEYDSSNWDEQAEIFTSAAEKYTGTNGYNLANTNATNTAKNVAAQAGNTAGAQAAGAARTAGMSRSKSIAAGAAAAANASANAFANAYNTGMSNAMQSNSNALSAYNNILSGQQHKDDQSYDASKTNKASVDNAIGSALETAGNVAGVFAASDENKKNIGNKTSKDRCDELLMKLKGVK